VAALTRSEQGSVILNGSGTHVIEPVKLGPLVDTTGAGDLYAAGFLFGHTQGRSVEACGRLGSLCAGQVVTQLGPRPQVDLRQLSEQLSANQAA
jgi:fructokinase